MFCAKCGTSNADGAAFCKKCGSPLGQAPAQQAPQAPQVQPAAQPVAQAAPAAQMPYNQAPYQQPGYPPAAAPMPVAPKAEGVLGAAWKDITSTPGWVKKMLFLCLIGIIPILNFAVVGYAVRWARELSFGQRANMPTEIFRKKEISSGFFAELVRIALESAAIMVVGLGALLIGALIGIINAYAGIIVGFLVFCLACIALAIFWEPVVRGSIMRMTIVGYLESGFNIKKVFAAFKKAMGSLIGASIVPDIIVGAIQSLIAMILYGIMFGIMYASMSSMTGRGASSMRYLMSGNPAQLVMGIGLGIILLICIFAIFMSMLETFAMVFSYRAVGHWAARNAKEWAGEADDKTVDPAEKVEFRGDELKKANAPAGYPGAAPVGFAAGAVAAAPMAAAPAPVPQGAPMVAPAPQAVPAAAPAFGLADEGTTVLPVASPDDVTAAVAPVEQMAKGLRLERLATGKVYEVTSFPATIGKGSAANVRIDDNDSVSRVHARIKFLGSSYAVEDLGATNKTYLNGVELAEGSVSVLKEGDELRLSDEAFIIHLA